MGARVETAKARQGGATRRWMSVNGHYNELTDPKAGAVLIFDTQLGPSDNTRAAQFLGQLIQDDIGIVASESNHPYRPLTGANSNSVVYTELTSVGITVPTIFTRNLPLLGNVGVLNYKVNGQVQFFTGWGQNLLP